MDPFIGFVLFGMAGIVGIALLLSGLKAIKQTERGVHTRFGKYIGVKSPGLRIIIPGVDHIQRVDIRERVIDMDPQEMLTKDKVSLAIDAMVLWRIKYTTEKELKRNAAKSVLDVQDVRKVMEQKAQAELREIISGKTFSEVLEHREAIAIQLMKDLDKSTDKWGIDVTNVQIKDVSLPKTMKRAMAQKAEADIEKDARIIKAKAEKEAAKIMIEAGRDIAKNPAILELRRLQTISEIGAEKNTTTVIMLPEGISNIGAALAGKK